MNTRAKMTAKDWKENCESARVNPRTSMPSVWELLYKIIADLESLESENADLREKLKMAIDVGLKQSEDMVSLEKERDTLRTENRALQLEGERMRGLLIRLHDAAKAIIPQADNQAENSKQVDCVITLGDAVRCAEAALSSSPSAFAEEVKKVLKEAIKLISRDRGNDENTYNRFKTFKKLLSLLNQLEGKERSS
jgi:CRISPR/Cas system CSM-associated protein Csm2 small subunit